MKAMKKQKREKSREWDTSIDKRIAKIKADSLKNGNHFIFILTSKAIKNGVNLQGVASCHNFDAANALESFLSTLPDGAMERMMMKRVLKGVLTK